ncbi:MAG: hypothetical protein LBB41_07395 [Prevotellaceae bacterium]|jgi:hypothetical protein|nr:hypothetical protein [Prevotellaceae bacterium]
MSKFFYNAENDKEERAKTIMQKFRDVHIERVESMKNLMQIPQENEITFIWSLNSFNAFTFIPFCIAHFGVIEELFISTYSINPKIINELSVEFDNGKIRKIEIFVSETLQYRNRQTDEILRATSDKRCNFNFRYSWNHSKVACARCGNDYFVFEGSGNWSENARYEQYCLINNKNVYEFRKEIIENG